MAEPDLATRAIDALCAVRAIEASHSHPMRHNVRALKITAESVLTDAFRRVHDLAFLANSIVSDYDKAQEEPTND